MLVAYLSDIHFGAEEDPLAFDFAVNLLTYATPDVVFLGGDIFNLGALSKYTKSLKEEGSLQEELDHGVERLGYLIDQLDGATKYEFLPGNHEKRLMTFLNGRAQPLLGLNVLSYRTLFNLDDLGIEYHPEGKPVKKGHLWLAHGHEFPTGGPNPAATALSHVGANVIFGHIHTVTSAYRNTIDGLTRGAWSNPCLCRLDPSYVLTHRWVNGLTLIDFTDNGFFQTTPIVFWRTKNHIETIMHGQHYRMATPRKKK